MADDITITIDGREVTAKPGTNVLQAAMDAGAYVPYLCYYPGMKSFGACRMCVVEIDGPRGTATLASCTVPVGPDMVVRTKTDAVTDLRRGIMDLLISEHPHGCLNCHRIELCGPEDICLRHVGVNDRCVTCPKNERCELKDTVRWLEMELDTDLTYNNRHLPQSVADPFWDMDLNLCIVCGRCVRICSEIRGDDALAFVERGGKSLIGTSKGSSLLESGCEFCGACIDVCPTGALVERVYKWDKAEKKVASACTNCPVGCAVTMEVGKRNRLIRTIGDRHGEPNQGQLCFKGKFGLDYVNSKQRLRTALVRGDGGELRVAAVIDAIDRAAEKLSEFKGDQFAVIGSERNTNEDLYTAQKFARVVMGTNNIDVASNLRPELFPPLETMLGYQAATNPIWDLADSKCFLVVSSNMTEEQNVVAVPIKKAVKEGAKLIVIDQRETELTRFADVWLRPKLGSETALIGGMLRVIVDESLDDHEFLADKCDGVQEFKNSLWSFDLLRVENATGLPRAQVQEAARIFANNAPAAVLYGLETIQPDLRADCVTALVNLALACGNISRPAAGVYPLYQGANEQGARDVGASPEFLPGYVPVDDEAHSEIESVWRARTPTGAGIPTTEITQAIESGRVRALMLLGNSPNYTNGELGAFTEALRKLDFLIVLDSFPSEITDAAHVVIPSTTLAETHGTITNLERRIQLLHPSLACTGEEDADWRTISWIAREMGADGFQNPDAESVFDEINNIVEIYGGVTYKRIKSGGLQWPCLAADMADTRILYEDDEHRPRMMPITMPEPVDSTETDGEYPLVLAKGRVLHDEEDLTIEKVGKRNLIRREQIIELHQLDGDALGIREGDMVEVASQRETLRGVARFSGPFRGLVSTTLLLGDRITQIEASKKLDPMLDFGTLPLTRVRVSQVQEAAAAAD